MVSARAGADNAAMIDKLEFLIALAHERHFGRAAETCGVTQPTLSAGLKQLEGMLGVRLVNRGARFHDLTPEGQRVLDWARRICADARTLRAEIHGLRQGLAGHLRIGAIPTALPIVADLTTPFRARHPDVAFSILSRNSFDILTQLDNFEIDAGLTYLDNEPVGRVQAIALYQERYRLVTAASAPLGERHAVTWAEVGAIPLCLLTPDMQNRRIIDRRLRAVGVEPQPTLQSNSLVVLFSHVRTSAWASVMPAVLADTLGLTAPLRSIPILDDEPPPMIGLVYPQREPLTPMTAALVTEARRLSLAWADRR